MSEWYHQAHTTTTIYKRLVMPGLCGALSGRQLPRAGSRFMHHRGNHQMNDDFDETPGPQLTADEEALLREMPALTDVGQARRTFLGQTITGGLGLFALMLMEKEQALAALGAEPGAVFAAAPAVENQIGRASCRERV